MHLTLVLAVHNWGRCERLQKRGPCRINFVGKTPNEGCQNNRDRALGSVNTPKLKSECSSLRSHKGIWIPVEVNRSLRPIGRLVPLNRGNLFLIVKRDISFFPCTQHICPEANGKNTMSWMGETHHGDENGHPFFWCIDTAWFRDQRTGKNTSIRGNSSRMCAWHVKNGLFSRRESSK